MTSKLLLRLAAVIMLLHAIGHTKGIIGWNKRGSPFPVELVKQMTNTQFDFMGKPSTIGSFYEGMGYISTFTLLLVVVILWILSGAKEEKNSIATKILMSVVLFLIVLAVDELKYFFPMAAAFTIASVLLTGMAYLKMNKTVI